MGHRKGFPLRGSQRPAQIGFLNRIFSMYLFGTKITVFIFRRIWSTKLFSLLLYTNETLVKSTGSIYGFNDIGRPILGRSILVGCIHVIHYIVIIVIQLKMCIGVCSFNNMDSEYPKLLMMAYLLGLPEDRRRSTRRRH